ncbi:MAG TPA: bifunctional alpha/beta hydrolase/OsmC family protein [Salinimicrobium sp.]|nr:bifunctional alpha/beta hydrolase/OsmC family protein [Salinimicrobium sp.]
MNYSKVSFKNKEGHNLSGRLELPLNQEPHNFALFAHCFTCNKNFLAVTNISRALTANGFGVLRFDFTGLGESEGEFKDTNFSGNVEDLIAAADFLREKHKAPSLLVGHSLGGAAVIFAAQSLPEVKAIATIGAPSNPIHVTHLLKEDIDEINRKGQATVDLSGREFTIKKQFLEDLKKVSVNEVIENLKASLLVMHSPQDFTVEIKNAEEIYVAAKHPKSFISLDGADHLLSDKKDSWYAGEVISHWAERYIEIPEKEKISSKHEVAANLGNEGFTTQIKAGDHYFMADEPTSFGGNNLGPTPYELISAGLAACTSMTLQMYARRKEWKVKNIETHVNYNKKHAQDCKNCSSEDAKIDQFECLIEIEGNISEEQRMKLLEIAKKCPVHKTLIGNIKIETSLKHP